MSLSQVYHGSESWPLSFPQRRSGVVELPNAEGFEKQFGSLSCRELRPEGFSSDNPPHICEDLSRRAIRFTTRCLAEAFQADPGSPGHRA
jgi:hypothetical protein